LDNERAIIETNFSGYNFMDIKSNSEQFLRWKAAYSKDFATSFFQ